MSDTFNYEFQRLVEENGNKVRTGQWKWVRFKDGYCIFDPCIVVNGKKVIPQEIRVKDSNEMMNECVQKYGKELLPFTWVVDKQNKAIVDDAFMHYIDTIAKRFNELEYEELKKECGRRSLILDWRDVKEDSDFFIIQPKIKNLKISPRYIQVGLFAPSVDEMIEYSYQLPAVSYRISEDFTITNLDISDFYEAIDTCKEILMEKYGEEWIEKRRKKLGKIIIAPAVNLSDIKEDDLLSISDKLRHKVIDKSIFDEEFELQWDDVKFYNGYYVFEPSLESKIKRLRVEPLRKSDFRCKRSFMSILGHFKNTMPKITYRITKDFKIKISNDPDFEQALIFLTKKNRQKEIEEIEHADKKLHKLCFAKAMERANFMTVEELIRNKNKYFDFLIVHQMKGYKVVPITESVAHTNSRRDEDSFMFTLKSHDGHPFIVVENVNIARASIVFMTKAERYEEALYAIFEYIQSDKINKRSFVREGALDIKDNGVVRYKSIDHNDNWERRMRQYFR